MGQSGVEKKEHGTVVARRIWKEILVSRLGHRAEVMRYILIAEGDTWSRPLAEACQAT
jgi:hypothetical protein